MTDVEAIFGGDRGALARGLTVIESGGAEARALLDEIWPRTGRAPRFGVTGPPGAGKSTLVAGLVRLLRAQGATVGVVAVDPTSPFTGGALLGDRHRMSRETQDEGVFVRSLASRGSSGGLARAAPAALDLLDAAGFDRLLVETVGVGQTEIEVAGTADSVVVVLSPESGDAVQAMKAGLLEIADILCVNKADREGAEALAISLEGMLDLRREAAWRPPVVLTKALEEAAPLLAAIEAHQAWLQGEGRRAARRRAGLEARLRHHVSRLLSVRMLDGAEQVLADEAADVHAGKSSVLSAAERAVERILRS
ncbi:MAG: methylmalonyl Co-A mutase-associated GTPase MeaB [Planctomycetota bacterium]|jgi:LAO/AO transport system kinase